MSKTIIYVVRHGLSEAKKALAHIRFNEVYSSDLDRAMETVSIIHGQPVPDRHKLKGLRERNFGVVDGLPESHLDGHHQLKVSLPVKEHFHYKHAEGMESDYELAVRYTESLLGIIPRHPGETILIGSHGSAMRAVLFHISWATHEQLPPSSIANTGYAKLVYNGKKFIVKDTAGIALN